MTRSRETLARFASHRATAIALGLGAILYCAAMAMRLGARAHDLDFSCYYYWAYALRIGLDPYRADLSALAARLGLATGPVPHANYPPTFLLCFTPLTLMDPQAAYWVWSGLNLLLLMAALWVLFSGRGFGVAQIAVLAAAAILYEPVSEDFFWAQAQIVLLFLLALNFRWAREGRDAGAGLALAMAILLKAYPAIMLAHFVLARRVRLLAWTLAGLALGGALTLATVGSRSLGFFQPQSTVAGTFWNSGLGVSATMLRVFAAHYPFARGANAARIALIAAAVVSLLVLGARATLESERAGRRDAGYGVWIVLTVFLFPITWIHHMVLLLLVFAQIVLAEREGEMTGSAPAFALASYVVAEAVLPLFWKFWLTWYFPLFVLSLVVAQFSGALGFYAAYRFALPRGGSHGGRIDVRPQAAHELDVHLDRP